MSAIRLARGEVVVVNDRFGVRIVEIVSPEERIKRLR
ncbi:MAG TPA: FliM/FliN family flagellar motor switch protein [Plasticicumulans sp.]|nr:FliM/FliN family flagellar motor switch protein [Plasticicumulans sp.]